MLGDRMTVWSLIVLASICLVLVIVLGQGRAG
jgi:hypothetical protein